MDLSLLLWAIAIVVVVYFILIWLPHTAIVPTYTSGRAEGARLISARNTEEQLLALGGRLDQFVLIGTHNSCHRANMLSRFIPHWQYTHAPLLEQLELGMRHIELDLWYNYTSARWEIWHESVDPLTTTGGLLDETLIELCNWSVNHPTAFPLWINLDIKGAYHWGTGFLTPWALGRGFEKHDEKTALAFFKLDEQLLEGWKKGTIYTPEKLMQSANSTTVHAALQSKGWPDVRKIQGHALFMLNLYGDRSHCRETVTQKIAFCRGHDCGKGDQIYFEDERRCTDRNSIVRRSLLDEGAKRSEANVRAARQEFEQLKRNGVHLVASNHPHLVSADASLICRNSRK